MAIKSLEGREEWGQGGEYNGGSTKRGSTMGGVQWGSTKGEYNGGVQWGEYKGGGTKGGSTMGGAQWGE